MAEYVPSIERCVADEDMGGAKELLEELTPDQALWDGVWSKLDSKTRSWLTENFFRKSA